MSSKKFTETKINVLDKGYVELLEVLGSDLTAVNAARASFDKQKDELDERDVKLIAYLIKHKHFSPFRHPHIQVRIKMPEVVARQLFKHCVGIEVTSSQSVCDHAWSEVSRRYIEVDEFYIPDVFRKQSESNKQGSQFDENGNPIPIDKPHIGSVVTEYKYCIEEIQKSIRWLLDCGVAREQAQMLLPISFYTTVIWTASFQAVMNLIELRDDFHAQWETRQYAIALKQIMLEQFPICTKFWLNE